LIRDRYAEIGDGGDATRRALNDFGFLRTLHAGFQQDRTIAEWAMFHDGGQNIARGLNSNEAFRMRIAREVFGMPLEDFEEGARRALRAGLPQGAIPNHFMNSDAHLMFGPDPDRAPAASE
jgi:hypothetical protein